MFITHHMMTLKHQFEANLPAPFRTSAATFVDLVPQIRRMGAECFLRMMTSQKTQLLEYLSAANGKQVYSACEIMVHEITLQFHNLNLNLFLLLLNID